MNVANCFDNLMTQEFELRTMMMYNNFLKPFAEISKCFINLNTESDEPKEDFNIIELDKNEFKDFKTNVESCIDSEDFTQEECVKLCEKRPLYEYKFPVNMFSALRVTFRIVFEAFTTKNADEFYLNYNGSELKDMV